MEVSTLTYNLGNLGFWMCSTGWFKQNCFRSHFSPIVPPPLIFGDFYCNFSKNPCLKPCIRVQNLQYKFLDWKWPPSLFGAFPKIHHFWYRHPSLRVILLIYLLMSMGCTHYQLCLWLKTDNTWWWSRLLYQWGPSQDSICKKGFPLPSLSDRGQCGLFEMNIHEGGQ